MQVMVLGAGRGTRLGPLGLPVPKILVDVAGEPLLSRQLRYLLSQGAERVICNAHHQAEQIQAFAEHRTGPPQLIVVREPELLGTAGGVRNALEHFDPGPLVILYGDVLTDAALAPLICAHQIGDAAATLTVYESHETAGKGTLEVSGSDRVLSFSEKLEVDRRPNEPPALINAGLYVLDPALVRRFVAPGQISDFGHDVFPQALAAGLPLNVHRLHAPVLDVGTPENWQRAQRLPDGD